MALDKLVDGAQLDSDLGDIADAIRAKGGTSAELEFPQGFVDAVDAIETGIEPTGTKQISITENGTTTEDVTNYANAEITVDVPSSGGGLKLLASGTHTHNGSTYLTIPVSYTGTAKYVFVCVTEPKEATNQCLALERAFGGMSADCENEFNEYMKMNGIVGYAVYYGKNSSNAFGQGSVYPNSGNLAQFTISATQIKFNKISNTYPWAANTYKWFIYGEEAAT